MNNKRRLVKSWLEIEDGYTGHIRVYLKWCGNRKPADLKTVLAHFRFLDGSHYAKGTIRQKRVAIIARLRYSARSMSFKRRAIFEERLKYLAEDCPVPKCIWGRLSVQILSPEDFKKCQEAAFPKQWGLLTFGYATGCRVSEVIGIRLTDCKVDGYRVEIRVVGKGKKERVVLIPLTLFERLREIYQGSEYLFETAGGRPYGRVQASDAVKRLTQRVVGRPLSYHKLRHSFVTDKLNKHPDAIAAISRYVGHEDPSYTIKSYDHNELPDLEF